MILILASIVDKNAQRLAEACNSARIYTCKDLAIGKLALRGSGPDHSSITVDEQRIPVKEIDCIVNLLPYVLQDELYFFPPEERGYQAEEFAAMIIYFISFIKCPVVNRLSLISLSGMSFNAIHWYNLASKLCIPVYPVELDTHYELLSNTPKEKLVDIIYFNGKIISHNRSIGNEYTFKLATRARVDYLKASYYQAESDQLQFVRARTSPDINDNDTLEAIVEYIHSIDKK